MTEEANTTQNNSAETTDKVKELEQILASREAEITTLKSAGDELQTKLLFTQQELTSTIDGYKTLLTSVHPEITAEMIGGENIKAINESMEKARGLMAKMKQTVLRELAQNKIPVGAPGRQTADLTGLSPREKINYGVGGKH